MRTWERSVKKHKMKRHPAWREKGVMATVARR
jgi:hypothetical protein